MITRSNIPQCHTLLGQITQGKITKDKVNPGLKLFSILHQCLTILKRKNTQAKITQENYHRMTIIKIPLVLM